MVDSPLPDGSDAWMEWLFVIGVGLGVFVGAMFLVQMYPGMPWEFEAVYSDTVGSFSAVDVDDPETSLKISQSDVEYLNRQYRELNTRSGDGVGEQGYCIDLVGDRISVQQAGTIEASESSVSFTTANCLGLVEGIHHFHPPGSRPILSGPETSVDEEFNDKKTFLSSDFGVSCVQAGLVSTEVGSNPVQFKCYSKADSGSIDDEFPLVGVTVVE